MELLTAHGEDGTNVAELGIGTNEEAILTGNILEDEKILGTAHVAFGASAAIGGTVQVPVHLDCVVLEPTVEIDGETIVSGGDAARLSRGGASQPPCSPFPTSPRGATAARLGAAGGGLRPRRLAARPPHRRRPRPHRLHPRRAAGAADARRSSPAPRRRWRRSTWAPIAAPTRRSARSTSARSSGSTPPTATPPAPRRSPPPTQIGGLGVPVFLYGELARGPGGAERAYFRNGGLAGALAADGGGRAAARLRARRCRTRRAGATLVTARPPLAAFNVELDSGDVEVARAVAAGLRESGGGLPGVRAIGLLLSSGRAQVSTNVHDPLAVPLGDGGRAGAGAGGAARRPAARGGAGRPGPGGGARRLSRATCRSAASTPSGT